MLAVEVECQVEEDISRVERLDEEKLDTQVDNLLYVAVDALFGSKLFVMVCSFLEGI